MTGAIPESARRPPAERALLWLEVLLAVGAFGGAAGLISGSVDLGAATTRLPFGSTAFAGFALAVVNGILPTGVWLAGMRRSRWARQGHYLVGGALVAWIVVQVAFLGWLPTGCRSPISSTAGWCSCSRPGPPRRALQQLEPGAGQPGHTDPPFAGPQTLASTDEAVVRMAG